MSELVPVRPNPAPMTLSMLRHTLTHDGPCLRCDIPHRDGRSAEPSTATLTYPGFAVIPETLHEAAFRSPSLLHSWPPPVILAGNLPMVDSSVRPGDDFYRYVNGAWLKTTEIPADRSSMSDSSMLSEQADQRTREIIQETAQNRNATADARKIADFYNAFMDEAAIEKLGLAPIAPQLREIAAIRDREDPVARARQPAARRRRCAQQHQFRHRQAARSVGGAGPR